MKIELRLLLELPFALNLPADAYEVTVGGATTTIRVRQGIVAAHSTTGNSMLIGTLEEIAAGIGQANPEFYKEPLRTVAEYQQELEINDNDFLVPTDQQIIDELAGELVMNGSGGQDLPAKAAELFQKLAPEQREKLSAGLGKKLTARDKLPGDVARFQDVVNTLIRLYMVTFSDRFVEEIALHQLGGTVARGVLLMWFVDGQFVYSVTRVGKIPPVLNKPWQNLGAAEVANFKQALANGTPPVSVELLCVRAEGFLERGARRSAVIEASAALETAMSRKISEKMAAAGHGSAAIETALEDNWQFPKLTALLNQVTGKTVETLDATVWARVLAHRKLYRNKIAHADLEPLQADTVTAVTDFCFYARAVLAM